MDSYRDNRKLTTDQAGGESPNQLSLTEIQWRALGFQNPFAMADDEDGGGKETFSLRALCYMIFRHKWKLLACFLLLSSLTAVYVSMQPDEYISEARLLILSERRGVAVDPLADGSSLYKPGTYGGSLTTEFGILQSWRIAEEVVDRLGVDYIFGSPDPQSSDLAQSPVSEQAVSSAPSRTNVVLEVLNGLSGLYGKTMKLLNISPKQFDRKNLAIRHLIDNTTAGGLKNSEVMLVTYQDLDPKKARMILNAMIDIYLAEHIEVFKSQISPNYFKSRAEDWGQKFHQKAHELEDLRQSLGVTSFDDEKNSLLQRYRQLENQLSDMDLNGHGNDARIRKLTEIYSNKKTGSTMEKPSEDPSAGVPENKMIGRLRERLLELRMSEASLASQFTDNAPQLKDVRSQIKDTEKLINEESGKIVENPKLAMQPDNPAAQDLKTRQQNLMLDKEAMTATRQIIENELSKVKSRLEILLSNEPRIQELMMEKRILEQEYMQYLNSYQITEITQKLDEDRISNVRVLQTATLPALSTKSQRKMLALLVFGCLLGLGCGIALAIGREALDQSIKTADDVEKKLGVRHIISVPCSKCISPKSVEVES